jgi:hypothetical protein
VLQAGGEGLEGVRPGGQVAAEGEPLHARASGARRIKVKPALPFAALSAMTMIYEAFDGPVKMEIETSGYGSVVIIVREPRNVNGTQQLVTHSFELPLEQARILANLLQNHVGMYD